MDKTHLKFIDLFAGIGGFHQALSSFGATCVFSSEIDKHASDVYFNNYALRPYGDITQIKNENIPEFDVLCAGFPCQAFSISGKQKGFDDARGTLFFEIARIVNSHQPSVLFLENVKNFVKHDDGNTLNTVLSILKKLGYHCFYQVLNASHFGVPQNRERFYLVAFHAKLNISQFDFPKPSYLPVCLFDILESDEMTQHKLIDRQDVVYTKKEQVFSLQSREALPNKPMQIGYVNKGGQGERIYSPYGHAITLSAHGGGIGAKTGLYRMNEKIRKLTPRECARLQGFPESFKIHSSDSQAYKQFGNSVPVVVLKAIFSEVLNTLNLR